MDKAALESLTYSSYLKIDELLALQQPQSDGPEHDETLFIIIHQVYELWFKQVLHELDYVQRAFLNRDAPRAAGTLKRVLTILKVMTTQIDVLETMTPLEFLSFRARLGSASGFQSYQFRELEFALGYKRRGVMNNYPEDSAMRARLERRYTEPGLWDAFLTFLAASGCAISAAILNRDVTQPYEPSEEVQKCLINVYRSDLSLMQLCERLVDLDEGLQEWRYRHIKMVERTIGTKHGTGGSAGVDYLKTTIFKPFFPDLWLIRTEL